VNTRLNHSKFAPVRRLAALALFLALCAARSAAGQGAVTPTDALKAAVSELAAEAEAIVVRKEVPKGEPDYAGRCAHDVSPDEIAMALLHRTHREPFVDAYIRWQLTSFDPKLPELDERAFAKFMDQAPEMVENPRADAALLDLFERAEKAGKLQPRELDRLRATYAELEKRTKLAELMNRPAEEFRAFIDKKLGETGVKPRLWLLEECVATIQAGWPTRSVKTRISKSFLAAANEVDMPREHLRLLAAQTEKLKAMSRRYVNEITILADGKVHVSFSTASVTEADVDKWINRLAGVP
jgi:hypothetical protein